MSRAGRSPEQREGTCPPFGEPPSRPLILPIPTTQAGYESARASVVPSAADRHHRGVRISIEATTTSGPDPTPAIRVFLLDDHEVVRRGCGPAGERGRHRGGRRVRLGAGGPARIPALRPDVAVLDARLPDGNGIDVCRDVRSVDPADPGSDPDLLRGRRGAVRRDHGRRRRYVLKQIRGTDLVDAVRRVAAGQSLLDPAVTQRVLERIRTRRRAARRAQRATEQERKILELVAEG